MSIQKIKVTKVSEVMLPLEAFPRVNKTTLFKEAIEKMNYFSLGIACITNSDGQLKGVITDGDIRRKLLNVQKPFSALLIDDVSMHYTSEPFFCYSDDLLYDIVLKMGKKKIWDYPVLDNNHKLIGLLHLHPALQTIFEKLD